MINDVINNELDNNPEIAFLKKKLDYLEKEIDEFDSKAYKNYRSNARLMITSFVSCLITVILLFAFHTSILPFIVSLIVSKISINKLMRECKEDEDKLKEMINNYNYVNGELKEIVYEICEDVINHLNIISNEAARLIKCGNFDEIISNYSKYLGVSALLDDEYAMILNILTTYAKAGVTSINELPEYEKNVLFFIVNNLNNSNPVTELKMDSFLDESDNLEEENNNQKKFVKKRPR